MLGPRERELLARLIAAEKAHPSELFVIAWVNGPQPVLKHPGTSGFIDGAAIMGLDAARCLLVQSSDGSRPKSFYLPSDAEQTLEDAERGAGAPNPLEEARAEIDRLEAHIGAGATRRSESARRFGRIVRWIVLPLVLLAIAGIAWILAGLGGAAAVIAAAVLYEVVTSGLGISGLSVAEWAERHATAWAERRLARWSDPEA